MNEERFHVLVEKYLEARLDEAEARELAEALEASPDLRAQMAREVSLAGLLARAQGDARPDLVPQVQAALRGPSDKDAMVARVLDRLPASRPRLWLAAPLAAALLLGAFFILGRGDRARAPEAGPAAATIERLEGEVHLVAEGAQERPEQGQPLRQGQRIETGRESAAVLVFPDSAQVRLGSETEAAAEPLGIALRRGVLSVEAPGAVRLITPHAEVFASARLSLRADAGATRLEVHGGRAILRRNDGRKLEVAEGHYAFALDDREALSAHPLVDPARVRAAVERGVEFLRGAAMPVAAWAGPARSHDLVLLALIHAGVPEADPFFQKVLAEVLSAKVRHTYPVAVQAVALEALDRVKYRGRLAECAQFLVDNQCENGQWSYGEPTPAVPEGPAVKKARQGPAGGNNSCTLFALLGLRACHDAGVAVPRETLERALRWWRSCQRPDQGEPDRAGWCYTREESPHHPYGSMSAGGLGSVVLCHYLLGSDWRQDPAFRSGLNWLTYHFTVHENFGPVEDLMAKEMVISDTPNPNTEYFYYLWAVERVAGFCGLERFGGRDWYAEGAHELLAAQRADGSWHAGVRRCQPAWDTSYAILFLTRSTRRLK